MKRLITIITFLTVFLALPLLTQSSMVKAASSSPYFLPTYNEWLETMDRNAETAELNVEGGNQTNNTLQMYSITANIGASPNPSSVFYYKKSALAQLGNAMAFMYSAPPANTYAFIQDAGQSLGFIPKKTYAADGQGSGYTGLLPILPIWKGLRNIAYGLLAVAMIIVGFMVMFRRKIDPKTVMTVQNSLPRIVVTLVLISFSYAIAGFLIDLMYVLILIGIQLLEKSGMQNINAAYLQGQYMNGGVGALFSGIMIPIWNLTNAPAFWSNVVSGKFLDALSAAQKSLAFALGTAGLGPLFVAIASLAYLFVFIRILFLLFSCYIQILMSIIISPLQLLMDIFPGSNQTSTWFKGIISNLLAFPITIFMLILGDAISQNFATGKLWEPPLLHVGFETASAATSNGLTASMGQMLIWLGILSAIPSVVSQVKELLKTKGGMQMGGVGAILGPIGSSGAQLMQLGYQVSMIKGAFARKPDTTPYDANVEAGKKGVTGGGR